MRFYKNFIRSFRDLPNYHSLLIHSLAGCNFKCIGCHNYKELIENKDNQDYFEESDILAQLKLNGYLFDSIIFSGGEFLLEDLDSISQLLGDIRKIFDGIIIINTNGAFPNKIAHLLNEQLVDGFHIDMKLPYHLLVVEEDKDIYQTILGIIPTQDFIEKLLLSIKFTIKNNSPYSQVRTVKYPMLSQEYFTEIEKYISKLRRKYNSNVPYRLNDHFVMDSN